MKDINVFHFLKLQKYCLTGLQERRLCVIRPSDINFINYLLLLNILFLNLRYTLFGYSHLVLSRVAKLGQDGVQCRGRGWGLRVQGGGGVKTHGGVLSLLAHCHHIISPSAGEYLKESNKDNKDLL